MGSSTRTVGTATVQTAAVPPKSNRHWETLRLLARNRAAMAGVAIIAFFALLATIGPLVLRYDATRPALGARMSRPTLAHPFGTDDLGRDILTRIAVGGRYSLPMGLAATGIAALVGVLLGLVAGYKSGWWDIGLMRLIDVLLTLPTIVLAIAIVSVLQSGVTSVVVAVAVTSIPAFARLTRSVTLTLREQDFISAARVIGAGDARILLVHLLPNTLPPIIVQASLSIGATILVASALGFLGLGVQPPAPEWGVMLSRGRTFIASSPHLVLFPGLAIAFAVLGFNLLGDGLRDALDPRLRRIAD